MQKSKLHRLLYLFAWGIRKSIILIKESLFRKNLISRIMSKALSNIAIARIMLILSTSIKRLFSQMGLFEHRTIEYPWVLKRIKNINPGSLILDVGCAESLLSHALIARGLRVVGLDIRDYPFRSKKMVFIKRNIMDTGLPNQKFDAIIVVSTIEHVGLNAYEQLTLDNDGDLIAMKEFYRILKPMGIIIITTPYIGNNPLEVNSFERHYNRQRLDFLVKDFEILIEEYFYPRMKNLKVQWSKMRREEIDQQDFKSPGLACLVIKKHAS
ncbi:class I SAM-dependent methyltransferase [[Eubacterium] cellulosolvens]